MKTVLTKTTYLEMRAPRQTDSSPPADARSAGFRVENWHPLEVARYRWLYNSVGGDWNWGDRNRMAEHELAAILADPLVEVHVLHVDGEPAGFAELDRRQPNEVELAYFGLFPAFIGRGLGKAFLEWTVNQAWTTTPDRVWLHTCDLDHPAALNNYLRAGFEIFDERMVEQVVD
ncbi:MAG: GNAT family N-acetyltransferase [Planctomycetales bacterium]|nr:GNAT family N-acetyltransferase [Planctomycetales bacterium]